MGVSEAPHLGAGAGDPGRSPPARRRSRTRSRFERFIVRLMGAGGVIGVGVALGAILASSSVAGWITGLVIAAVSLLLSGLLWRART